MRALRHALPLLLAFGVAAAAGQVAAPASAASAAAPAYGCPAPGPADYPAAARRAEATGTTRVVLWPAADGSLIDAAVAATSGVTREHALLDRVALEHARRCRLKPLSEADVAAGKRRWMHIDFVWKLDGDGDIAITRQQAEAGRAFRQLELARRLEAGAGVARDTEQAAFWYRKAAEGGQREAQLWLAQSLLRRSMGAPGADTTEAVGWARDAAEAGFVRAQLLMARLHAGGSGVPQDDAAALSWWRRAAQAGDPSALAAVARAYADGRGVERDEAQALAWTQRAAEAGDHESQLQMAARLDAGRGLPADAAQATAWTQRAAEAGAAEAQRALGWRYLDGRGVRADAARGAAWVRLAADRGLAAAHHDLGQLLATGRGVAADPLAACVRHGVAARMGQTGAREAQVERCGALDAAQRAEADKQIAAWPVPGTQLAR